MTGNQGIRLVIFLQGKEMSEGVNVPNLALSVDYHWRVPVMEG